ncbi:MAG: hypothetical protein V4598_12865 [Bdellovibrionota bacterium]
MTRKSGLILLILLCLAFGLTAWFMPVSHNIVRLLFIEDACWTVSWLIFAWTSFKLKRAEYPVKAMAVTLAVEIYLFYHYTIRTSWPFDHWLLINYLLWPLSSCINLVATYLYGREELVSGGKRSSFFVRLIFETGMYILIFWYAAGSIPQNLVMVFLGQTVIGMISLYFLTRTLSDRDPGSRSLAGNLFRMAGGILCYYANSVIWKDEHGSLAYLRILMPVVMMMDLVTVLKIAFTSQIKEE